MRKKLRRLYAIVSNLALNLAIEIIEREVEMLKEAEQRLNRIRSRLHRLQKRIENG